MFFCPVFFKSVSPFSHEWITCLNSWCMLQDCGLFLLCFLILKMERSSWKGGSVAESTDVTENLSLVPGTLIRGLTPPPLSLWAPMPSFGLHRQPQSHVHDHLPLPHTHNFKNKVDLTSGTIRVVWPQTEINMKMERNQRSMLKVLESLSVAKMIL